MNQPSTAQATQLHWNLEENPGPARNIIYALQWLSFSIAQSAVVPVILGVHLGLDMQGTASLALRIFFFTGLGSLLQVLFGHRLPIIEGPASLWWATFISLALMAKGMGRPVELLRSDLQLGLMITGALLAVIGATGLVGKAMKLFTPAITGTVLVLLTIQMSGVFVQGVLGMAGGNDLDLIALTVAILVVALVIFITLRGKGLWRTIGVFLGMVVGWLVYWALGLAQPVDFRGITVLALPQLFGWGRPTFEGGVVTTSILVGLILTTNVVTSITALGKLTQRKVEDGNFNRGILFNGLANFLAGAGASVGNVSFAASAGLVGLSGVAARIPFLLYSLMMMVLGLIPAVGRFIAALPSPVGYAVFLVTFCQLLSLGLKDYNSLEMDRRDSFVIGLSVIVGTGVMALPEGVWAEVPGYLRYLLGNGLVTGMLICILLEHLALPKKHLDKTAPAGLARQED